LPDPFSPSGVRGRSLAVPSAQVGEVAHPITYIAWSLWLVVTGIALLA
jgi:hypothetical protein